MFDADRFKLVNDHFGHSIGDRVLKKIAEVTIQNLRDVDIFGRIGGEEFAIILPETGKKEAISAAERLRDQIGRQIIKTENGNVQITVSVGIAFAVNGFPDVDTLLKNADKALYQAKEKGRNRVEVFE
jgi:diguanylate cyclase (GGDEF)-like protein